MWDTSEHRVTEDIEQVIMPAGVRKALADVHGGPVRKTVVSKREHYRGTFAQCRDFIADAELNNPMIYQRREDGYWRQVWPSK